jgi:hypothetical protein
MPSGRARRAETPTATSDAESAAAPKEEDVFFPDTETTPRGKNDRLAQVLTATGANGLAILSIKRLEIGGTGWLITCRT